MSYYEASHRIAREHMRLMHAIEREDILGVLKHAAVHFALCWSPTAHLQFWREIWTDGWRKTFENGMRGAIDGITSDAPN